MFDADAAVDAYTSLVWAEQTPSPHAEASSDLEGIPGKRAASTSTER